MADVILFLLRLAGLLLLAVLGLLFAVLLAVFVSPLRYRLAGAYDKKAKGSVRLSWLLHILSVTLVYEEQFSFTIRIFGIRMIKPGKSGRRRAGRRRKKRPEEDEDFMVQAMEVKDGEGAFKEQAGQGRPEAKQASQDEAPKKRSFFFSWLPCLKTKLYKLFTKIKFFFQKICDTLKTANEKKTELYNWISDEKNQKTVKLLLKQAKKLLRHILPLKGRGSFTFGFEDPYLTGQVLTYISVLYPLCHKGLNLFPVFDREVLEGEGSFQGRIRLGTILWFLAPLLFDKNFRTLLRRWI